MNKDAAPLCTAHDTWWKAPMAATLPGLPLLVWEFGSFSANGYTSGMEIVIVGALILLAAAWLLPRRRSMRVLRTLAAGSALGIAFLPIAYLLLLVLTMAYG
ncbi:hypothetical protein ACIOHE_14910 [Streptomyces sp. NPDC087851]|uniref:hypothetical protein n=1 Tax=Streptomyces sp. NPDC087851 TaxID=3365810 RepID=UPI00381F8469